METEVYFALEPRSGALRGVAAQSMTRPASIYRNLFCKVGVLVASGFNGKHPRYPGGSPDSIGGEFAPKTWAGAAGRLRTFASHVTSAMFGGFALITSRGSLKAALRLVRIAGSARARVFEAAGEEALQVLTPAVKVGIEEVEAAEKAIPILAREVKDGIAHVRAAEDFAGGKTLTEIIEHPGGPGYQLHHFLENTAENRLRLPPGFCDMREQKGYIPTFMHEEIHAELSKQDPGKTGVRERDALRNAPWLEQQAAMFKIMRRIGILK